MVEEHRNALQGPALEFQGSNKLQLSELGGSAQRQSLEVVEGIVDLVLGRQSGRRVDMWVDPLGLPMSGSQATVKVWERE